MQAHSHGGFDVFSAQGAFALNLYNTFALENAGQNFLMSPVSIFATLAMILPGARHSTLHQMLEAMSLNSTAKLDSMMQLHASVGKMLADVARSDASSNELLQANKLYVESGYPVHEEYLTALRKYFGAEVVKASFATSPDTERERINQWVSTVTKGKITDLLGPDAVSALTRLILVNAVFFKAKWSKPFDPRFTQPMQFETRANAAPVPVLTMNKEDNYHVVRLPNKLLAVRFDFDAAADNSDTSGKLAMYAILPAERHQLDAVMSTMTPKSWLELLNAPTQMQRAIVSLPKLQLSGKAELSESKYLPRLGIKDLFGGVADLSGIASTPGDLRVTTFAHRAVLAWDELGAEGAAATGMGATVVSMPPIIEFNEPFVVIVTKEVAGADNGARHRVPIFVGRVSDPSRL